MDMEHLEAASEAFGSVFVVVQHLTRLTDEGLADWDLTTRQWLLLAVLTRAFAGRSPSLSEAAAAYGSSRQNVKQIALGLQARGFLRLQPDPRDARTTRLELTDRVAIFDSPAGQARGRDLLAAAFDGMSPGEVVALRALVVRWLAALSASTRPTRSADPTLTDQTTSRKGTPSHG